MIDLFLSEVIFVYLFGGRRGCGRMVVGYTTTYAISAEFEPRSWRGVLNTKLCDDCQWFSPGPPFSSSNETDRCNITEILLKVALNTLTLTMYNLCDEEVTVFIKIINLL